MNFESYYQFGFMKNRSTAQALACYTDCVRNPIYSLYTMMNALYICFRVIPDCALCGGGDGTEMFILPYTM